MRITSSSSNYSLFKLLLVCHTSVIWYIFFFLRNNFLGGFCLALFWEVILYSQCPATLLGYPFTIILGIPFIFLLSLNPFFPELLVFFLGLFSQPGGEFLYLPKKESIGGKCISPWLSISLRCLKPFWFICDLFSCLEAFNIFYLSLVIFLFLNVMIMCLGVGLLSFIVLGTWFLSGWKLISFSFGHFLEIIWFILLCFLFLGCLCVSDNFLFFSLSSVYMSDFLEDFFSFISYPSIEFLMSAIIFFSTHLYDEFSF